MYINHKIDAEKHTTLANCSTILECTQLIAREKEDLEFEAHMMKF